MQLTKLRALPRYANSRIGQSVVRASSATSFTSLLFARRLVPRNHQRLPANERVEILKVSSEVLSGMIGESP